MTGAAQIGSDEVDLLLRSEQTDFPLFTVPKQPVGQVDHAIGLHAAQLVRDGGTLQIGIGAIGDAVTHGLLLRQRDPDLFRLLLQRLGRPSTTGLEQQDRFVEGLYGVSEMFVDGFLHLAEQGILKRKVDGAVLHGGFFVGSRDFYQRLLRLTEAERETFQMVPVSFTNALYGAEDSKRQARVKALFINSAMMVTLRGAVISDALEDGRVVSGVGGQYNFAAQAFALDDARFVITLNATRQHRGKALSNIVWSYGHETLPWHLRDIVITEYGVADLRGCSESDAVKAMLKIADSRFQSHLLEQAQQAGKIDKDWRIPAPYNNNTPAQLEQAVSSATTNYTLPKFPLGTDFTETEQRLLPALKVIRQSAHSKLSLARLAWTGLRAGTLTDGELACLQRMELQPSAGLREYFYQLLLRAGLVQSRRDCAD
jgi:acyl-CoA hydrolase